MFVYPVFRCFVYSVPGPRESACGGDDDGAQLGPITEAGQIESDISSRSLARASNEGLLSRRRPLLTTRASSWLKTPTRTLTFKTL